MTEPHRTQLLRLTPEMERERRAVARLHLSQLPDSDVARLGEDFLRWFNYGVLLEDPRYLCYVCLVDGGVAGFTSFSTDAAAVMAERVRSARPRVAWHVARALLVRPLRLTSAVRLARAAGTLEREPYADIHAEVITTAIDPSYRSLEFYRRTGVNVARQLYENTARVLVAMGIDRVKGTTRPSNHMVHAAIGSLGWRKVWQGRLARTVEGGETCIWVWDVRAFLRGVPVSGAIE